MRLPLTIALSLLVAGGTAFAGANPDVAGAKTLHDYVLTMDKVKRFSTAIDAMGAAVASDPALRAEGTKMSSEPDKTLADVEAKLDHHPRVFAYYAKQGLTKVDVAVLPIALMDACTVAQMPQIAAKMADRVSDAQIVFCKAHIAELKKFRFFSGGE